MIPPPKVLLPLTEVGAALRRIAVPPVLRDRTFFIFEGQTFSYRQTYAQARRYAGFFSEVRRSQVSAGALAPDAPLHLAMYQENTPEFVFAYFGAAISGDIVFGVNTGMRDDALAVVLRQAEVQLVITDEVRRQRVDAVLGEVPTLSKERLLLSGAGGTGTLAQAVRLAGRPAPRAFDATEPLIVIYTSGTTSAPKGVPCSHMKLVGAGALMFWRVGLRPSDRGYITLPMFHSNVWLLGVMPLLTVAGSFVLRRRFSASAFEDDILEHGISYMNYVGHPIHYILDALEQKYGSGDAVQAALSKHPANRFRIAQGNGASAVDRQKLVRYLGMEHIYEIYGSTEAPITTVVAPGDPLDSVGEIKSADITVLGEGGAPCPPATVDAAGKISNYAEAVGEIVRKIEPDNVFFDGYFKNPDASNAKYRDGYYRSGDLGHIRVVGKKRYLYFDGRTDDWIRKDGENFSAQNVCRHLLAYPPVALAAAYGVPSEVADEKVMVALLLREGATFDPQDAFDWLTARQHGGGLDPKWMPDYIRIVDRFQMSETQKILVRHLKHTHFDLDRDPKMVLFRRQRHDTTYQPFTASELADVRQRFDAAGRLAVLDAH